MRRILALLGAVLVLLGMAEPAMARSGSDSSGQYSYTLDCVGGGGMGIFEPMFQNTSGGGRAILVQSYDGGTTHLNLANTGPDNFAGRYDWDGGWRVVFQDPGSGDLVTVDADADMRPSDVCDETQETYSATGEIVCAGPGVKVTNTGTGDLIAYGATIGARTELPAGASHTFSWGTGGPGNDLLDPTGWDVRREDNGSEIDVAGGTFSLAQYNAKCNATYSVTAKLVCVDDFEFGPSVEFTRTGTGDVYVIDAPASRLLTAAQPTWVAPWQSAHGDLYPETHWEAYRSGAVEGEPIASGSLQLTDCLPKLTATPGNGSVTLRWTLPTNFGGIGSAPVSYTIESRTSGVPNWNVVATTSALTHTVTGLTNGQQYWFHINAHSSAGTSMFTPPVSVTPKPVLPSAPRTLAATPGASGQVKLTWLAPSSTGGAAITDYVIQRSANGTTGWTTINDGVRPTAGYTVTGLTNGVRYYFRVLAKNAVGTSVSSNVANNVPRTVPSAVRSLTATPGNRSVVLRWAAPASNGGAAISDYVVQRSANGTSGWVTINDGVRTTPSYTVTGLTNGARYYFRVLAKNAAGTGASSNVVNQVPRTVPSATRLRAYPGSGRALLTWTPPTSNGGTAITRYAIQRSTSPTSGWAYISSTTPATARSFTATGLRNATRYYFRIAAINAAGVGTWSPVISVVPSALAGSGYYFPNCTAVGQAGAAPLLRTQPGYRIGLDRDRDGMACE